MLLDALPDVNGKQVMIRSRWDRSPDLVDAQLTDPIVSDWVGAPRVKTIRGFSGFIFRLGRLRRSHRSRLICGFQYRVEGRGLLPVAPRLLPSLGAQIACNFFSHGNRVLGSKATFLDSLPFFEPTLPTEMHETLRFLHGI